MFSVSTPYILLLALNAVVCLGIVVVTWRQREENAAALSLSFSWATAMVWVLGYACYLGSNQFSSKLFWLNVTYIGIVFFPVSAFLVVISYTGLDYLRVGRRLILTLLAPMIVLVFIWTNPLHELFISAARLEMTSAGFSLLVGQREIGFWIAYAYGYTVAGAALTIGLQAVMRASGVFKRQIGLLVVSTIPLLAANLLYVFDVLPFPEFDLSPFMFLPMGAAFVLGLFRFQLLDLAPITSETIIKSVPNGLIVVDDRDRVLSFNAAAQRITVERALEEGALIRDYIPDWESVLSASIMSLSKPAEVVFPGESERPFEQIVYEVRISPLYRENGGLYGRLITLTDITERKEVAQLQQRQNEYMDALHETSLGLMQRLDSSELLADLIERASQLLHTPHGFIYLSEPNGRELRLEVGIGYFEQLVGQRVSTEEGVAGQVWRTGHPMLIANYANWPGRVTDMTQEIIGAVMALPLGSGEKTVGVIGVATDREAADAFTHSELDLLSRFARLALITLNNAELYAEVAAARAEAERANEAKSNFLANVSHELRTPLTSIMGFAKMNQKRLEERILPEVLSEDRKVQRAIKQVRQNFDIILKEGERLSALINDVLDLEKIEAGRMEWHMEPLTVSEVIERVLSTTYPLFEQKNLKQQKEVTENLPLINGDRDQLHQVMMNLVSNAVKFTDEGSVTCRAKQIDGMIEVSVTDTGIGIAEHDLPRVFDKFTQLGNTLTDKPKGTGLGLPICEYIVEQHGGKIWLESAEGVGTTFYFTLPVLTDSH